VARLPPDIVVKLTNAFLSTTHPMHFVPSAGSTSSLFSLRQALTEFTEILLGETPVIIDTDNVEHFYDGSDHSTYYIVRREGDFNVVKVEEFVPDEGEDGKDKMPLLPKFPYRRERAPTGQLKITDSTATIVYDVPSDSESDDEGKAKGKAAVAKSGNKVIEALSATARQGSSQSE
jgi:hypothetical protein